ncbi:MAG: hypothetical protein KGQ59_04745 [Bdellovibrionales bacterium]|nr:hypothetical protein [Bdellovibrionales bacterium]
MKKMGVFMSILFCLSVIPILEQLAFSEDGKSAKGSNVLNFEADVIEGEKRRPDLFIQMESTPESLDSILYSRKDFNDFHEMDRKWRPKVRKPGRTTGRKSP